MWKLLRRQHLQCEKYQNRRIQSWGCSETLTLNPRFLLWRVLRRLREEETCMGFFYLYISFLFILFHVFENFCFLVLLGSMKKMKREVQKNRRRATLSTSQSFSGRTPMYESPAKKWFGGWLPRVEDPRATVCLMWSVKSSSFRSPGPHSGPKNLDLTCMKNRLTTCLNSKLQASKKFSNLQVDT